MSTAPTAVAFPTWKPPFAATVIAGALLALGVAFQVANPTPAGAAALALLAYLAIAGAVMRRPFVGLVILSFAMVFLIVFAATPDRYLNPVDLFLPLILPAAMLGGARARAIAEDARATAGGHEELHRATRSFVKAGLIYFGLAIASLPLIAVRIGTTEAIEIAYSIARCLEGALILPLGLWVLRTEKQIGTVIRATWIAGVLLTAVNIWQVFSGLTFRAGMTWIVNHPEWPVEDANEAGATIVIVWALLMVEHQLRPRKRTFVMLALMLTLLFLTQSRSGLLALLIFIVLSTRRIRWQYLVVGGLIVAAALLLAPADYLERLTRSVSMKKGTFEVYTMLIRVYGYQSSVNVFLDHWLFGVGYMSCRYVSQHYNDLRLVMLGAENFFLETASGLGVIGLAAVTYWYVRLFQLGRVVKRIVPAGTRAAALVHAHAPLMIALSVANLTGNNFMGLIGTGQLMLWAALLIRSAHLAHERDRGTAS